MELDTVDGMRTEEGDDITVWMSCPNCRECGEHCPKDVVNPSEYVLCTTCSRPLEYRRISIIPLEVKVNPSEERSTAMQFIVIWNSGFQKICFASADSLGGAMDLSVMKLVEYLREKEITIEKLKPQCNIEYIG